MIVSRAAACVLGLMESGYDEVQTHTTPYDDLTDEDEELLSTATTAANAETMLLPYLLSDGRRMVAAHRDAFISSMYLGGCGAFLSLPALCMWDMWITVCFVSSLAAIGGFSEHSKIAEFKPNIDRAGALLMLKRLQWSLNGAIAGVLVSVLLASMQTASDSQDSLFPMMILAAVSPLLLRLGSIRAPPAPLSLSPSQCLEAGLPVSTLLAILVLCWFSPLDQVMIKNELLSARLAIPMFIFCPSCLAAILGFVLRGFRQRHSTVTAAVLACACAVRQQAVTGRLQTRADWLVLASALQCAGLLTASVWYRWSVVAIDGPPPSTLAKPDDIDSPPPVVLETEPQYPIED